MVGYLVNTLPEVTVNKSIDVGVSFSNISTVDGSFTIGDSIFDDDVVNGDTFLIFNANAYNYDWYQYMVNYDGLGNNAWMVMDMISYAISYVESFKVKDGDSIVFMPSLSRPVEDRKITVSGEVADLRGASRVFNVDKASADANDFRFPFANPYPIDTTAKLLDGFIQNGDTLLVWNDGAYNYDWYQYMVNYDGLGNNAWMVMDMISYDISYLTSPDDIILPAGHGAIFIPDVGGVRTWTVSLEK